MRLTYVCMGPSYHQTLKQTSCRTVWWNEEVIGQQLVFAEKRAVRPIRKITPDGWVCTKDGYDIKACVNIIDIRIAYIAETAAYPSLSTTPRCSTPSGIFRVTRVVV
jgi:hypothetical protein